MDERVQFEDWSRVLGELPPGLEGLARLKWLHKRGGPDHARRLAESVEARRRARGKLAWAERLWLHKKGLEQATDRRVAAYRARRFAEVSGMTPVLDGTAGVGGDALELAASGVALTCVERDPNTAAYLRANLRARNLEASVRVEPLHLDTRAFPFFLADPDRRTGGPQHPSGSRAGPRRTLDPERWSPTWSSLRTALESARGACIKLPPTLPLDAVRLPEVPCSLEWISVDGELKELALWTGELAFCESYTALVLRGEASERHVRSPDVAPLTTGEATSVRWIADPDPALATAGALGSLARALDAAPLARDLGYLGLRSEPPDPLPIAASCYQVIDSVPMDVRRVRAMLAAHDIGPLVVKKRGLSETAAELGQRLKGKGKTRGLVLAARLEAGRRLFLVRKREK